MVGGARGEGLAGALPMSEFVTPREEEFTTPRDQAFHSARNEEAKEAYTTPRDEGDSYQTPRDEQYSEQKQADEAESKWAEYKDEEHTSLGYYPDGSYPETSQEESPSYEEADQIFSLARHNRLEEVEGLLDGGLPVDMLDPYGNTILHVACQNGLKKMAKVALRRGANINAQNVSKAVQIFLRLI